MNLLKKRSINEMPAINLPKTVNLSVSQLKVDDSYQRNIIPNHVNNIRKNFDPDLFGTIVVSERDGHYHVIDGQNRLEAVRDKVDKIPCSVWTGLTYEQECAKFRKLNSNRRALNASIIFNSKVCEGNKTAIKVAQIIRQYGFKYNRYNMSVKENMIGSPARMLDIYERDGESVLCRTLNVCRKAWHGEKTSLRTQMIVALKTLIVDYPELDDNHLIKVLSGVSPQAVSQLAAVYVTAKNIGVVQGGGSKYVHIANAMREIYNDGLPKGSAKRLR